MHGFHVNVPSKTFAKLKKRSIMKKKTIKRTLLATGAIFMCLVLVLCVHVYLMTRPKAPDAKTVVLARIDLRQPVTPQQAADITAWMYRQKGVNHAMCSATMDNVVFTYKAIENNADDITAAFKAATGFANAARYIPTEKDLQGSCPVASTSVTYKLCSYFRHLF
jgi:hypothetical protein